MYDCTFRRQRSPFRHLVFSSKYGRLFVHKLILSETEVKPIQQSGLTEKKSVLWNTVALRNTVLIHAYTPVVTIYQADREAKMVD
jgi:hypothetical protein